MAWLHLLPKSQCFFGHISESMLRKCFKPKITKTKQNWNLKLFIKKRFMTTRQAESMKLVEWANRKEAKRRKIQINLFLYKNIDIQRKFAFCWNILCNASVMYIPSKHTTSFWRPYNVHNVKTTSYGLSKQRRVRTGYI